MANSNPLFTEVTEDGKLLKFADTQHFTGENNEGRARTGEKNPFPVAGYGMTESGIWVPNRVSDKGEQLTQLTGSNVAHSEDEKPEGKNGDSLFLWDTREVFLHDGTDWRIV